MAGFGILLGLSAPGYNIWMLAWLVLIPALLWVQRQPTLKRVFLGGFWLGFLYHGLFCLWFFDLHPLAWLGFTEIASRLVTLGGWLIITVEGGLLGGMLMVAYKALKNDWARLLLFPLLWVFGFSMLNWTPMALPWALLEYTQAPLWPMRALASLVTGSGVAALVVFHNAWAARLLQNQALKPHWKWALPLAPPMLVAFLQAQPAVQDSRFPIPVGLLQANLPIEVIRSASTHWARLEQVYLEPLRTAHFPTGTLLVYPEEGVVPGWVSLEFPEQNPVFRRLIRIATARRIYIAVGVSTFDSQERQYNSIALIPPDNSTVHFYHKRRLVPFGEFTPYGLGHSLTSFLASLNIDYSTPYTSGDQATLLPAGGIQIGGLVCFELIDANPLTGGYAAYYKNQGASLLINTSNLGWFHENPLIEAQFLAIGQMRAAETGLPLVIASNTGTSAVISRTGTVLKQTRRGPNPAGSQVLFHPASTLKNSPK